MQSLRSFMMKLKMIKIICINLWVLGPFDYIYYVIKLITKMITTIKNKTVFLHNGDMSGKVKVRGNEYDTLEEVEVPFEDLEAFVIEHSKKIKRWKEDSNELGWTKCPDMMGK